MEDTGKCKYCVLLQNVKINYKINQRFEPGIKEMFWVRKLDIGKQDLSDDLKSVIDIPPG